MSVNNFNLNFVFCFSLSDLHAANQYYHLLQQLNEEASKNPQMIPVLLNALRMKEDIEYDEPQ